MQPPIAHALCATLVLASCAHEVHTTFPGNPGANHGQLRLVFTEAVEHVNVSVNGTLVVEDATTNEVRVDRVESGYADVAVAAGAIDKQFRVWVPDDGEVAIPVATFEAPRQSSLWMSLLSLAATFAYLAFF